MARLVDRVKPDFWSEHLALVRGGGIEIGHLAAPPRNAATVAGAAENVDLATRVTGSRPLMENISTLIAPPGNRLTETQWVRSILDASGCDLLLDLHNVYVNGQNHGYDPVWFIRAMPAERLRAVHIAGGRRIRVADGGTRWLDDHLHAVPDPVYGLLEETAELAPSPLTVILERDGAYPAMPDLMAELECARQALARGRARRRSGPENS